MQKKSKEKRADEWISIDVRFNERLSSRKKPTKRLKEKEIYCSVESIYEESFDNVRWSIEKKMSTLEKKYKRHEKKKTIFIVK